MKLTAAIAIVRNGTPAEATLTTIDDDHVEVHVEVHVPSVARAAGVTFAVEPKELIDGLAAIASPLAEPTPEGPRETRPRPRPVIDGPQA